MQEREPEQVREKAQETKPEQVREKVQDEEQGKPGNRRLLSRQIKNLFCSLNLKFMMKIIL